MQKQQIQYYKDELNDEFEGKEITPIKIDGKYKYVHNNIFWKLTSFLLYRIIATPIAYLYMKFKFRLKIINKDVLKGLKGKGYFMYVNHTQDIGDAFNPTIVNFPRKVQVVVHPNNVSIPFWGNIIKFLGPLPIPGDIESSRNFMDAIQTYIDKKNVITIYPEAHVWNYYTKIRTFKSHSFKYPIKAEAPVVVMTITYNKTKREIPQIVAYIDGPFYADKNLSIKDQKEDLRNKAFNCMSERAKNNNIEYIKYIKAGE